MLDNNYHVVNDLRDILVVEGATYSMPADSFKKLRMLNLPSITQINTMLALIEPIREEMAEKS